MRIDHVIWKAADLDRGAARIAAEYGLRDDGGGRHVGIGTHNRVFPLGGGYLEVLAVADPEEAKSSPPTPIGCMRGSATPICRCGSRRTTARAACVPWRSARGP